MCDSEILHATWIVFNGDRLNILFNGCFGHPREWPPHFLGLILFLVRISQGTKLFLEIWMITIRMYIWRPDAPTCARAQFGGWALAQIGGWALGAVWLMSPGRNFTDEPSHICNCRAQWNRWQYCVRAMPDGDDEWLWPSYNHIILYFILFVLYYYNKME